MTPSRRVGFISTRFAGTDGVSLETAKWASVFERLGLQCFYFCGECDRPEEQSYLVPEAFFRHPAIEAINLAVYAQNKGEMRLSSVNPSKNQEWQQADRLVKIRSGHTTQQIQDLKVYFKQHLYQFTHKFNLQLLVVENALAIPLNLPLGLAITEFIAETGCPMIAHHHDLPWERQRFMNNSVNDYLEAAFPPKIPSIRHVVINSIQQQQLALRSGLVSMVIPNVMDFDAPPPHPDEYARSVREDLGVDPGCYLILQPTRIIPRKGIEHAIELTSRLGYPAELVISHASGDEGDDYEKRLREFAAHLGVKVIFGSAMVSDLRGFTADGKKIYALGDLYPQADLVTFPSLIEGFGNAFLEAVYYKRPLVVNRYSVYETDIRPKGFMVVELDGYVSEAALEDARHLLTRPEYAEQYAEHNYQLGCRHYSFTVLERSLRLLLADCFGENA